jgi:hypothetical protein
MKRTILAALLVYVMLAVAGCGSDNPPPTFVADIFSDPVADGDIRLDPVTGLFLVTQGNTQIVKVGIDPADGAEFRAFLDFPLGGQTGQPVIPISAIISSATLDIFVDSILPQPFIGTIPIRIDLVDLRPRPPTFLNGSDFDRASLPALATTTISLSQTDFGQHVFVDVTSLMAKAQLLGLPDFQIRILRELGPAPVGLVDIDDSTVPSAIDLVPLLTVVYF